VLFESWACMSLRRQLAFSVLLVDGRVLIVRAD
jgi:hypothetical protein